MILAQSLAGLIDFCVIAMWIFYVVSMILVLVLRKIRPDAHRPYRVHYKSQLDLLLSNINNNSFQGASFYSNYYDYYRMLFYCCPNNL